MWQLEKSAKNRQENKSDYLKNYFSMLKYFYGIFFKPINSGYVQKE